MIQGNTSRSQMRRALLGGRIIFNNNCSVIDCIIREISETGAVLELGSTFLPPSVFVLETKPFKQRHACNVDWRTPTTITVSFVDTGRAVVV